jgi:putative phosphoribosyl transferase
MQDAALFVDRADAGRRLAGALSAFARSDAVVLGLPRGGVPVAYEVARALGLPLDVILVRKLGVPFQPELAMGAIGEDGVRVINARIVQLTGVQPRDVDDAQARETRELERRARLYRGDRPRLDLSGRTAMIVDDGIATGSTVRAACKVARAHGARRVVVATPVAPPESVTALRDDADEVIALDTPAHFAAIGQFYRDFSATRDEEVVRLLGMQAPEKEVAIDVGGLTVSGRLSAPAGAHAIVVFAHGSGSSRHSPRNRYVADVLERAGLGTLLFDLLTTDEERDRAKVFDIPLLACRLVDVTAWLRTQPEAEAAAIGYFGASTGAAAALWASTESHVGAIVSRGGRPDLASPRLVEVTAPTLLIVGGDDTFVLELNRDAQSVMTCETHLALVPGASHLFEEPGTLAAAAELARDWFVGHLSSA